MSKSPTIGWASYLLAIGVGFSLSFALISIWNPLVDIRSANLVFEDKQGVSEEIDQQIIITLTLSETSNLEIVSIIKELVPEYISKNSKFEILDTLKNN